ncbi:MAG: polyribonucleotide nucleotidyltransferase [Candidatus Babeliales bacterium]
MVKTFQLPGFGFEVEIGKVAQQADGAVWFKQGGTVVLATAVSAPTEEFAGFLPLTVDYREQYAAAGKIPGGYFKREGKSSDKEVLTSRLIDRAIRPLFPEIYFHQLQVLATVYSVDKEHMPNTIALVAVSLALSISKIPFMGPIGAVEVARVDGEWILNPTFTQSQASDVRLVVAGSKEGINMVEGSLNEVSEDQVIDMLFKAHDKIKEQIAWQEDICKQVGVAKEAPEETDAWTYMQTQADAFLTDDRLRTVFITDTIERADAISALRDSFIADHEKDIEEKEISQKLVKYMFDKLFAEKMGLLIVADQKRIDNRPFTQVRPIAVEVGLLPGTHGSSLFIRGRTQALALVTLGTGQDQQQVETLMGGTLDKTFMLHYNFPPFSAGEVRGLRAPGRREIGHGHLAASAVERMLPAAESFPYTIRIVVDILESDGSTSMATTCAATMSLMNAGVPIKKMVSGIAMGLLQGADGRFQPLSDINGNEDAYGLMDFKVTGTREGITALQMDIKYKGGLPREVFQKALAQARDGRIHILQEMQKVMTVPNPTLSPLVPKIVSVKIPTEKIGAIIGSGGKVIKEITEKTGTSIDIEENGLVNIFGKPEANIDQAIGWVKVIAGLIQPGDRYAGKVKRVAEFGIFVELAPGTDGLVHISMIPKAKQQNLAREFPADMQVHVEVMDYDESNGRIRLRLLDEGK